MPSICIFKDGLRTHSKKLKCVFKDGLRTYSKKLKYVHLSFYIYYILDINTVYKGFCITIGYDDYLGIVSINSSMDIVVSFL